MDIGNQQRVIIVEAEPVKDAPLAEPAQLIETAANAEPVAESVAAWPLPLNLDGVPAG